MKKYKLVSLAIFSFSFFTFLSAQNIYTIAGNGYNAGTGNGGYTGDGGPSTAAELATPYGVVVNAGGDIYISDNGNDVIRMVNHSSGNISTYAGIFGGTGYSGDGGAATAAEFNSPTGISLDPSGNLYIADALNSVIRKVDKTSGIITTVAGNNVFGYTGDGGLATAAELKGPTDVKFDVSGNMFIAEFRVM